jgi:hypothetical protein
MTRRSGAAKALVEQPGSCLPRAQASPGPGVNPVIPNAQQEVRPSPSSCSRWHLTSTIGEPLAGARANRSLETCVTVAVCNAALRRPSDSGIAGCADFVRVTSQLAERTEAPRSSSSGTICCSAEAGLPMLAWALPDTIADRDASRGLRAVAGGLKALLSRGLMGQPGDECLTNLKDGRPGEPAGTGDSAG